jgi:hypothetical protein
VAAAAVPKAAADVASNGGFSFDLTTEDDLDAEFTNYAAKKDRAA